MNIQIIELIAELAKEQGIEGVTARTGDNLPITGEPRLELKSITALTRMAGAIVRQAQTNPEVASEMGKFLDEAEIVNSAYYGLSLS